MRRGFFDTSTVVKAAMVTNAALFLGLWYYMTPKEPAYMTAEYNNNYAPGNFPYGNAARNTALSITLMLDVALAAVGCLLWPSKAENNDEVNVRLAK